MECKSVCVSNVTVLCHWFNRYIVECKFETDKYVVADERIDLIDT